jgi:hypothetical protein
LRVEARFLSSQEVKLSVSSMSNQAKSYLLSKVFASRDQSKAELRLFLWKERVNKSFYPLEWDHRPELILPSNFNLLFTHNKQDAPDPTSKLFL